MKRRKFEAVKSPEVTFLESKDKNPIVPMYVKSTQSTPEVTTERKEIKKGCVIS